MQGPNSDAVIQSLLPRLVKRALLRGGKEAFDPQSIKAAAIHEAGHAILSQVTGTPPIDVRIRHEPPPRGGWLGHTRFGKGTFRIDAAEDPRAALNHVCFILAGGMAEQLLEPAH